MSLDEEMDFVKSYIYLKKIRFDGNLAVDINQAPGYGIGLGNLCQQYAIYGKSMEILRRHDEFAVRLPYIE